jgi:uncharacterized membrane protein
VAVGLGLVSGLRTFQGLAWTARALSRQGVSRRAPVLERFLARDGVAAVLGLLAAGELAVDKVPGIPDRVDLRPLLGRATAGALAGAVVAGRGRDAPGAAAGAAAGAVGALAGAYAGWFLRRQVTRSTIMPDGAIALLEDALAAGMARRLTGID